MSLQHVALTSHSLCKGGKASCATSCSSTLCVLENRYENLSPQQLLPQQVAQVESDFLRLVAATKFCCRNKDFHKSAPVHTKRWEVSLRLVVQTCRPVFPLSLGRVN